MDSCFEERLCKEIRRYPQLYDSSLKQYRDSQITLNSWREIAHTLGRDEIACRQKWKYLRDRYVKAKRKLKGRSGDKSGSAHLPPIVSMLDWLSGFIKHRATESNFPGDEVRMRGTPDRRGLINRTAFASERPEKSLQLSVHAENPHLLLSSLRLLVPPLRLMSACMWQVAQERNVDQYDKLAEFMTLVTEMVPELLNYKQRTQLILGLRARLILDLLKRMDEVGCKAVQDHLNSFQKWTTNCMHEEDQDGEVEISKSAFVELVQTLLGDQSQKDIFFKEVFQLQYGVRFDTALQILIWEFFYRLEEFLPVPSFSQVFSMFDISSSDDQLVQFVSDHEDLKRILQHQQERQKLTKKTAGEVAFQSPRCSENSVEEVKQLLENTVQSSTGGRPDGSRPLSKNSIRGNKNTCLECGKTFSSCSALKNHCFVHTSARPFKCTHCHNTYKSRKDLNQHVLNHSKPKVLSFACNFCEKRFSSQGLLTVHLRHHTGERPFACSYCDKRFLTKSVLKSHVRIHTGERPYACTLCDKKFTQLYPRTVHLRMHMKEKPYLCSTCGMSFCSSGALLVHSRSHTGERPYRCEACGKAFATAAQLTLHRRSHTGERPYSCSQCDKSFHSCSGLKKHMRTHTGEKPHQCLTCHKTFSQKSNMKIHLKVHKNI
ncbi:zinc finger protein 2-like isoform X3 [Seriola lalandi dorsalis]|uniref:zinc finger protein 2-like isoform X3 n=1 Tax=Seriola lalandi dorsalis TaxID=1841481 RepID=UPI000C6F73F5|nr:zinc finger protein 2-like isoform X3 [Seriola lalandi dorsalis]